MSLTSDVWSKTDLFHYPDVWVATLLLALVSTEGAYVLYTAGLKYLEAGKASILATIEPIVAVLVSVLFLGDHLGVTQVLGIALALYSAVLIVERRKRIKIQTVERGDHRLQIVKEEHEKIIVALVIAIDYVKSSQAAASAASV